MFWLGLIFRRGQRVGVGVPIGNADTGHTERVEAIQNGYFHIECSARAQWNDSRTLYITKHFMR